MSFSFWATVCKTVRHMLSDRCLSVLSVCPVLSVTFVHCGQMVGRIKMKCGMQVGLVPGYIVLGHSRPSQLLLSSCCKLSQVWLVHYCCYTSGKCCHRLHNINWHDKELWHPHRALTKRAVWTVFALPHGTAQMMRLSMFVYTVLLFTACVFRQHQSYWWITHNKKEIKF